MKRTKTKPARREYGVKTCRVCEKKPRMSKTSSYCVACNTAYMGEYREMHREELNAASNVWTNEDRKNNPEYYRERERAWRKKYAETKSA